MSLCLVSQRKGNECQTWAGKTVLRGVQEGDFVDLPETITGPKLP